MSSFLDESSFIMICHERKRQDVTMLPVRFWTMTKFPNYVIVYRPETNPLQVVAVLHGKRDLKTGSRRTLLILGGVAGLQPFTF
jgi:hypothetical protein